MVKRKKQFLGKTSVILLLVLLVVVLYRNAWLGDDAFITFRVVDNFINGYGLTWNPGERVQVYTHPLWLFLLSGIYFFTREIFLTSLFVSMAVTVVAAGIFAFKIARDYRAAMLGLGLMLVSKTFIDYSSSGLENPLNHLLIIVFFYFYVKGAIDRRTLFRLTLVTSLAALNRFDTIVLFLPLLVYYFFKIPGKLENFKTIMYGLSPLILWECFSLFYYGFPFPNTAFAKLSTGLDHWSLLSQGARYLNHFFLRSPVSFLAIVMAVIFNLRYRGNRSFYLMLGMVLYLLYVVKIGGCFMTGRFFSAPFILSLLILLQYQLDRSHRIRWVMVGILILGGLFWPRSPLWSGAGYGTGPEIKDWYRGISDERAAYFQSNSLLNVRFSDSLPDTEWAKQGREAAQKGEKLVTRCGIGQFGFSAGPEVHILDCHALTDPLLARLPITAFKGWRIGHFRRVVPEGYEATLLSGENQLHDKDLARYYEVLRFIVRGPLFSSKRLWETMKMNLGFYNHHLKAYLSRPLYHVTYEQVRKPVPPGTSFNHNACRLLSPGGIVITFDRRQYHRLFEVSLDNNDVYQIIFYDDTSLVASLDKPPSWSQRGGLAVDTVLVPEKALTRGYDRVALKPVRGDRAYSFGHFRFLD
ncbi:MAG: hypothetical protein PHN52_08810 [candidate division Zixibacteria bacterium]|nr:hypothetical protein [candidate division Zixibacteria bacterium]